VPRARPFHKHGAVCHKEGQQSPAVTASDLIDFLRRLVRVAMEKVLLVLEDVPVLRTRSVQDWLAEHVDEIVMLARPRAALAAGGDRAADVATGRAA